MMALAFVLFYCCLLTEKKHKGNIYEPYQQWVWLWAAFKAPPLFPSINRLPDIYSV